MLKGTTRFYSIGSHSVIYIPIKIATDSAFPFTTEDKFKIEIVENKVVLGPKVREKEG